MKSLLILVLGFGAGYFTATRVAPFVQAKIEAFDLDEAWDVFNEYNVEHDDEDEET